MPLLLLHQHHLPKLTLSQSQAEGEPVEPSSKDTASAKDEYFVRFKVRFEWVESQGTPWFTHVMGKERFVVLDSFAVHLEAD